MEKMDGKIPGKQNDGVWNIHCVFLNFRMTEEVFKSLGGIEEGSQSRKEKGKLQWMAFNIVSHVEQF